MSPIRSLTADGRPRPLTFLFNGGPGILDDVAPHGLVRPDESGRVQIRDHSRTTVSLPDPIPTLCSISAILFSSMLQRQVCPARSGKPGPRTSSESIKDLVAFTRTIERYLTKYERWNSPKFIIGESYGTTRAAGLSRALFDQGVQLNGITFMSTVFNFADFEGDQADIDFLPTYAADAWYHGKIPGKPPLDAFLDFARQFASGPYAAALQKGNAISDAEKQSVAQQMSQLTGLGVDYIMRANLRVNPGRFRRELLRDRHEIIGRIDSASWERTRQCRRSGRL